MKSSKGRGSVVKGARETVNRAQGSVPKGGGSGHKTCISVFVSHNMHRLVLADTAY